MRFGFMSLSNWCIDIVSFEGTLACFACTHKSGYFFKFCRADRFDAREWKHVFKKTLVVVFLEFAMNAAEDIERSLPRFNIVFGYIIIS